MFSICRIQDLTDPRLEEVVKHPELWEQTNGQNPNLQKDTFKVDSSFEYLLVEKNNKLVALFSIKRITYILVEAHIRLLPDYRKDAIEVVNLFLRYIRECTEFKRLMTQVPANCINVIKFLEKMNCKFCGGVQKAIIYNNELVSLFFFERDLKSII